VAVVSRAFADRYWPGDRPIGKQVSGGGMDDYWDADPPVYGTVIGVVGDVRFSDLTHEAEPTVYWHYRQRPFRIRFGATLVAEAAGGDPAALAPVLRSTVRAADPDVAVPLRALSELVADSVAERRFLLLVLAGFAGVALVLAAVGIYGVVSYAVARRTREMGIRLALGAAPQSVVSLVLTGALRSVGAGLVLGILGGLALSGFLRSLLYEVPPTDPVTFSVVPLLLLGAALLASWLPARRGTRVDPIKAMRAE
jgi:predicted lysophospholipase L1 biosynthesis ABC-type transport system permease subunit